MPTFGRPSDFASASPRYTLYSTATQNQPLPHYEPSKVYILDCSACGAFLTNRGMRAVLLLRPDVPLYSTDALPVSCSAWAAPIEPEKATSNTTLPRKTCLCLTQSLLCHGCGTIVGYMIVSPCAQCTSSLHGATNHHRFVFHSNRVKATERLYVHNEPGITDYFLPKILKPDWLRWHDTDTRGHTVWIPVPTNNSPMIEEVEENANSQFWPTTQLPTPPEEEPSPNSDHSTPPLDSRAYPFPTNLPSISSPLARRLQHTPASMSESSENSLPPLLEMPSLKQGDNLYWHHLVRCGEIPACTDHKGGRGVKLAPVIF